jgi:RHS repeat-associated protein
MPITAKSGGMRNMTTTYYFWDPVEDNIVQEREEMGAVIAQYTTEPCRFGNVISQNRGGVECQFHCDGLGSTLAETDANQQLAGTQSYSAFGDTIEQPEGAIAPFGFVGRRGYYTIYNADTIIIRRRYYHAKSSRWMSLDPLGIVNQHVNLYDYALNSPITLADPSGLETPVPPTPLPEITPFPSRPEQRKDIEDCINFYDGQLRGHPVARSCFQDYLRRISELKSPLARKICSELDFACICCGSASKARFQASFVFICADCRAVRDKNADSAAQ